MMTNKKFSLLAHDKHARRGELYTRSGVIPTPHFLPVVTHNKNNAIGPDDYNCLGANGHDIASIKNEGVICNSLLAYFEPGINVIEQAGRIHDYLGCHCPVFTDSGGFQASSLSPLTSFSAEGGLDFFDPYSNSSLFLTPEVSMQIQQRLGCDVALMLDDLVEFNSPKPVFEKALNRTHRWAEACLQHHSDTEQLLFGICQGGAFDDLRGKSARLIDSLGFDGVAIGGVAICNRRSARLKAVNIAVSNICTQQPRYVMGIGSPVDIVLMVEQGVDLFDAAYPSIAATNGQLMTGRGLINIKSYRAKDDALDSVCQCTVCKRFSRADLSALLSTKPNEAIHYLKFHNLHFISEFMRKLRAAIEQKKFTAFKLDFLNQFQTNKDSALTC